MKSTESDYCFIDYDSWKKLISMNISHSEFKKVKQAIRILGYDNIDSLEKFENICSESGLSPSKVQIALNQGVLEKAWEKKVASLKFASVNNALQYLADFTNSNIIIS